jgi:hypothetical protein
MGTELFQVGVNELTKVELFAIARNCTLEEWKKSRNYQPEWLFHKSIASRRATKVVCMEWSEMARIEEFFGQTKRDKFRECVETDRECDEYVQYAYGKPEGEEGITDRENTGETGRYGVSELTK